MFTRITIHLAGPICSCDEQSLQWNPIRDKEGRAILEIMCKICGTQLLVAPEKFVARFQLERPYPGKPRETPKKQVRTKLERVGNVIRFPDKRKPVE